MARAGSRASSRRKTEIAQAGFDRIKPIVEKMDRRPGFRLQSHRLRAIVAHGVVSTGAQTPASFGFQSPGDYATCNSNHTPDGTCLLLCAVCGRVCRECAVSVPLVARKGASGH